MGKSKSRREAIPLPIPGVAANVYTMDLVLGDKVLTPIGIGIVRRRIPLLFSSPGRYRLIVDIEKAGGIETIKLITLQYSIWHIPY